MVPDKSAFPTQLEVNAITGATGCGKTTINRLICEELADRPKEWGFTRITHRDTSACIKESRKRRTPAGLLLLEQEDAELQGKILSAKPVFGSMIENITWIRGHEFLRTFLSAGSPRTEEEARLLLRALGTKRLHVFHIISSQKEVWAAIERRIASGELRADDGPATFETKWKEYHEKVLPAVAFLPKQIVTEFHYSMPLVEKMEIYLKNMVIQENVRRKMLAKLHTRNHPIHARIHEIETGKKLHAAHRATERRTVVGVTGNTPFLRAGAHSVAHEEVSATA
jgi:adenylate kinase family enzyme